MLQASETCSEWDEQLCTDSSQKVATVFRTLQSDNYVLTTWCLGFQQASAWDVRSIQFASARVACGAALVMEVSSCPLRPPLMPQKAAKGADASRSIQTLLLITTYTLPLTTSYLLFITNIYYRSDDNVWHEEGGN